MLGWSGLFRGGFLALDDRTGGVRGLVGDVEKQFFSTGKDHLLLQGCRKYMVWRPDHVFLTAAQAYVLTLAFLYMSFPIEIL